MDNILKLTVGCLGLVGLIVMIVPNSDPLASTSENPGDIATVSGPPPGSPNAAPPPPPPPPGQQIPPDGQDNKSEFATDDYDIATFGQPMVDPTPPAERALITQQQQQQQNALNANSQSSIAGTGSESPAGPPPPVTAN
jgi:hypothetical protein